MPARSHVVAQGAISKLEHSDDVRVSTLRQYLEARDCRHQAVMQRWVAASRHQSAVASVVERHAGRDGTTGTPMRSRRQRWCQTLTAASVAGP